ncbi:hypothetical protein [Acetobacter malorum]|uniref:hypothetical protein n=1 Tax=Acetobacter malorum TaxID=178901 RepID=UPI001178B729|nr:hypothetical protein [Acetobacter malorum]
MSYQGSQTANAPHRIARNARITLAADLRKEGLSFPKIAQKLGVNPHTARSYVTAAAELGSQAHNSTRKVERFHRHCLCCNAKIAVESPYLRMCATCRSNARGAML